MRIEKCPVMGRWRDRDTKEPCGSTLYSRATVLEIAPSTFWEISEGGEILDWEDQYGPEGQESGEGMAFYCSREHTALQIADAVQQRHPAEVYGTPEHEALLIEEERGT